MKTYQEKVKESKNYNNYKLTADKIIEKLDGVRDERTKSRRRWIWELMQNAKDVPNTFSSVSIKIELLNDKFIFCHNGDPFKINNITGLIQQVSSGKPSNSSNNRITGKFGTGFISTHLLSDIVYVEGIVEETGLQPKKFKIELNRRGKTSEELIDSIARELDRIEKIEDDNMFPVCPEYHANRKEDDYDSVFTYIIDNDDSRQAAITGVKDLSNTLPQTLLFVKELKKVSIHNEISGDDITYELIKFEKDSDIQEINKATIRMISRNETKELNFVVYQTEELSLAVEVLDFQKMSLITNPNTPKLYRDFPLVGTEKFYFPFILNGLNFFPTEKRDNILLSGDRDKPLANKQLLEQAIEESKKFIEWLSENKAKNLSIVTQTKIPDTINEEEVKKWYKEHIQVNYRSYILDLPIVESSNGNITLKEAIIPKIGTISEINQEFWDIVSELFGEDKLCKKEQLESWFKYIGPETELKTWGHKMFFNIEQLLELIQKSKSIINLRLKSYNNHNIDWLNHVYQFLIENKLSDYFNKYALVSNINGNFKLFNELFIESSDTIPDEFINILKTLSYDWNDILVHRETIVINPSHAQKTVKEISDSINKILDSKTINLINQTPTTLSDKDDLEQIILYLLSIQSNNGLDSFRNQLFTIGKKLLHSDEQVRIVANIQDFNFSPAIKNFIKLLNKRIEVSKETKQLGLKDNENWLSTYLNLLQSNQEFKSLLEIGNIVPNLYGKLCAFEELYNCGTSETPLDINLVDILSELNSKEDWRNNLVANYLNKFTLPQTKKFDELANSIQQEVNRIRVDEEYTSYSSPLLALINWCTNNLIEAQKYFGTFLTQKDKIFVNISIEDEEVGNSIIQLLENKEKLTELTRIIETEVDLTELLEIAKISKIINIKEIKQKAILMKEEKEDFEFKKKIGNEIEKAFMTTFTSLGLPYEIIYQGIGAQDFIIRNRFNGKEYYIELKSLSPNSYDKSIRLALSQVKKAVKSVKENNYAISVIIRPKDWKTASANFIKSNLQTQLGLGIKLKDVIEKDSQFERLIRSQNDINLEFENLQRKVKVSESIWKTNSQDFNNLINRVVSYLN